VRKIQKLVNGAFVATKMLNLEVGDVYRIQESDGTPVGNLWQATSLPTIIDGIVGIDAKEFTPVKLNFDDWKQRYYTPPPQAEIDNLKMCYNIDPSEIIKQVIHMAYDNYLKQFTEKEIT